MLSIVSIPDELDEEVASLNSETAAVADQGPALEPSPASTLGRLLESIKDKTSLLPNVFVFLECS